MPEIGPIIEEGFSCWLTQEWTEWFGKGFNWRSFHFIEISYEDECCMGQRELVVFLLGIGITLKWCYDVESPGLQMVKDRMAEIRVHPDAARPLAEYLEERAATESGQGHGSDIGRNQD